MGAKSLSQEQIDRIYETHNSGISQRKAAKYAGVNHRTICKYWNNIDLLNKLNSRKVVEQKLIELVQQEIKLHKQGKLENFTGNNELGKLLEVSQPTLIKTLKTIDERDLLYRRKIIVTKAINEMWEDDNYRERMSKLSQERWEDPDYREIMIHMDRSSQLEALKKDGKIQIIEKE